MRREMKMNVKIISEHGYFASMLGLSLSYNQTLDKMPAVADRLKDKYGGHNKFLESIVLWVDVTAPRYFWSQGDTYRISTKQSQSTMHTLLREPIVQEMFENPIHPTFIEILEDLRFNKKFQELKDHLPEGFLQRRVWMFSYMTLKNMINQRSDHKLPQWQYFIDQMKQQVENPELL